MRAILLALICLLAIGIQAPTAAADHDPGPFCDLDGNCIIWVDPNGPEICFQRTSDGECQGLLIDGNLTANP